MNFEKVLIRCSGIGNIMTDPQSKEAKEKGELSKTCKTFLTKVYNLEKYGRKKDVTTKHMEKGIIVEENSIDIFSRIEKKFYKKNTDRITNEFLSGTPDLYTGDNIYKAEDVHDLKSSWDLDTFMANVIEPLNKDYYWQLQGYFALTGAKIGSVAYCLVTAPERLINDEKRRLLYKMDVATEENEDYKLAAAELEYCMVFDDIPIEERVLKFQVERNDADIQRIYEKIKKCRLYLAEMEEKHLSFNQKNLVFV